MSDFCDNDLVEIRSKIDLIDGQILSLLNERSHVVRHAGQIKEELSSALTDSFQLFIKPERENDIISRVTSLANCNNTFYRENFYINLWRHIIAESNFLEQPEIKIGAFNIDSKIAAYKYYGFCANIVIYNDVEQLVSDLGQNNIHIGILPLTSAYSASNVISRYAIFEFENIEYQCIGKINE